MDCAEEEVGSQESEVGSLIVELRNTICF